MPGVGVLDLPGVQQDGLGGVARLLLGRGVLQQAGNEVPKWISGQNSLEEDNDYKNVRSCFSSKKGEMVEIRYSTQTNALNDKDVNCDNYLNSVLKD